MNDALQVLGAMLLVGLFAAAVVGVGLWREIRSNDATRDQIEARRLAGETFRCLVCNTSGIEDPIMHSKLWHRPRPRGPEDTW